MMRQYTGSTQVLFRLLTNGDSIGVNRNRDMGMEHEEQPEQDPDGLTPEQRALAEALVSDHKDRSLPASERRDCEHEVAELLAMFKQFEAEHPLAELHAITGFTTNDEARSHPVREPARLALIPIVEKLNSIEKETNISFDRFTELEVQYIKLWKAVGIMHKGKFSHEKYSGELFDSRYKLNLSLDFPRFFSYNSRPYKKL